MIHLVSLSAVTWSFPLMGRTRMLTEAWQRLGFPTTFVQAPFLRTALERLLPFGRSPEAVRVVRPWPTYPRRLWPHLSGSRLRRSIRRRARGLRRQLDRLLNWERTVAVVVSPAWTPWLDELPFRRVVYDCIDALEVHLPRGNLVPLYRAWEAELIRRAAAAVVTAEELGQDIRRQRSDLPLATIRNGVDVQRFRALAATTPVPVDLPRGGRPLVGFVGVMSGGATYEWLDWELVRYAVRALPEFDFVFVGPHQRNAHVEALRALPNAHLLGWRPYERIPAYVSVFTVCWVPFSQGPVGNSANPVKIYEYLALGKPVVSTPVADTDTFGSLVAVAHDPDEMVQRLRAAVREPPADAAARVAFARENSWEARARALADFAAALGQESKGRGARATADR